MQDFIFNSKKQAARKRRRFIFRLLLLAIVLGVAAVAGKYFFKESQPEMEPSVIEDDVLTLPPADSTQNVDPSPSTEVSPATATDADEPILPESIPESAQVATQTQTNEEIEETREEIRWLKHKIGPGESLAKIFKQQNLTPGLLHKIVHSSETAENLANIRPGEEIRFGFDSEDKLEQLILQRDKMSSLHINAKGDSYLAEERVRELDTRQESASGIIESSLFVDGQKAGLADSQIMEMAAIFGWDIDFALEIREGDSFNLVYEEHYLDGEKFRNGPILAAEFINKGTTYRALRYESKPGEFGYFDAEGRSKKRAFIRTPVKFARISSRFNPKRLHPVLKTKRPHRGVDYAAPTGTPVKAAGAGKITFRGTKGGYGKAIFIRHGGKYTTVYGHLSKFSRRAKKGSKVKQGQIIGYVGSTGLATGPHLHYEFRVNGVHRNPLTVKLPKSDPLPKKQLKDFKQQTASWVALLDQGHSESMVASATQINEQ